MIDSTIFRRYLLTSIALSMSTFSVGPDARGDEKPESNADSAEVTHSGEARTWALLVGVTKYPSLIQGQQLKGPGNDVTLLSALLRERFSVPSENIVTLVESDTPEQLPTRANIQREFRILSERVRPGDQVVVLLAGHGSQQPELGPRNEELDGLDEIFLPRDIGTWNPASAVENAISDNELHEWLSAVRAKGTYVFFIADTCHSGTLSRGDTAVPRDVSPEDLGVPSEALAAAKAAAMTATAETTRGKDDAPTSTGRLSLRSRSEALEDSTFEIPAGTTDRGGFVALYAANPHELTYEQKLPTDGEPHGWLSWALNQILTQSESPLSYGALAQRIHWNYQQQKWIFSHPLIEGSEGDLDREVLGLQKWPGRSQIRLTRNDKKKLNINAGTLRGITAGSVLAVYGEQARRSDTEPDGYLRVIEVSPLSALVTPTDAEGSLVETQPPVPAVCTLTYLDPGEFRVLVQPDVSRIQDPDVRYAIGQELTAKIKEAEETPESMLKIVAETGTPDWYAIASPDGQMVSLVSADYLRRDEKGHPVFDEKHWFGPHPLNEDLSGVLVTELGKIARAMELRRLAILQQNAPDGVRLDVTAKKVVDRDRLRFAELTPDSSDLVDKDEVDLVIRNPTRSYVDVTVLYVQSDSAIKCFFPAEFEFNRLPPGGSHTVAGIEIDDKTTGLEDLIIIGVTAGDDPNTASFRFLAQQSLAKARRETTSRGFDAAWESPLGRLSRKRILGEPASTRGADVSSLDSFAIHRISWTIRRN